MNNDEVFEIAKIVIDEKCKDDHYAAFLMARWILDHKDMAERLEKAERLNELRKEYIKELVDELNEIVGLASLHGWKSKKYEREKELRVAITRIESGE